MHKTDRRAAAEAVESTTTPTTWDGAERRGGSDRRARSLRAEFWPEERRAIGARLRGPSGSDRRRPQAAARPEATAPINHGRYEQPSPATPEPAPEPEQPPAHGPRLKPSKKAARRKRKRDEKLAKAADELQTYLALLFLGLPGAIELRPLDPETGKPSQRDWIPAYPKGKAPKITEADLEEAAAAIAKAEAAGLNTYLGIATRAQGGGYKRDLGFVRACWTDVDRPGATVEEVLGTCDLVGVPQPSLIVHSGNGLHCYWILRELLYVNPGHPKGAENLARLEAINRGLARLFRGDSQAFNADRILRPPGTTNRPNARKRAMGRVEAPVRLVHADESARCTLDDLAVVEDRGRLRVVNGGKAKGSGSAEAIPGRTCEPRCSLEDFRACLDQVPVLEYGKKRYDERVEAARRLGEDPPPSWRDLLMAAHHAGGGQPEFLEAVVAWSLGDPAYAGDRSKIEARWRSLDAEREDGYRIGTLIRCVKLAGGQVPEGMRTPLEASDAAADFGATEAMESLASWETQNPSASETGEAAEGGGDLVPILSGEQLGFERDKEGRLYKSIRNAVRAILLLDLEPRYDEMGDRTMLLGAGFEALRRTFPKLGREVDDFTDDAVRWALAARKETRGCASFPAAMRRSALDLVAHHRAFNPVEEWLRSLRWDGQKRLDSWLVDYCGTPDAPYARAVGSILLRAAVARIFAPSTKYDTVAILEGEQGTGRSSLVRVLGGEYTLEGLRDLKSKDTVDDLRGAWFVELEELSVARKEDVQVLKGFISRIYDRARLSYNRRSKTYARRFVLVGTTNEATYLRDDTGNRRFLPVRVTREVDLEGLRRVREQLFAEAVVRWDADPSAASLVLPRELWAAAAAEQAARRTPDPWEEVVARWVDEPERVARKGFQASEILADCLLVKRANQTKHLRERMGTVMRKIGWRDYGTVRDVVGGKPVRFDGFKRPPSLLD